MKIKDYLLCDTKIIDSDIYIFSYYKKTVDGWVKEQLEVSGESINRGDKIVFDADIANICLESGTIPTKFKKRDFKQEQNATKQYYLKFQNKKK